MILRLLDNLKESLFIEVLKFNFRQQTKKSLF